MSGDNQSSQTTLMQQVLDIPQSQRVADMHHHRQADELGARLEVAEDAGAAHTLKATGSHPRHKPILLLRCHSTPIALHATQHAQP